MQSENKEEMKDYGKATVKLKKSIKYNDKEYESLSFDFDKLTGNDALNIESELQAAGKYAFIPSLSSEYLIRVAAKACTEKIGADIFCTMSLTDFNAIRQAAKRFLTSAE